MRTLLAMSLLFATEALAGEHHFVSPNGEFEAYTIAANEDGTGMKRFLRRANSPDPGVLLRQNNRWIDAKWSPDSHFLAVMDHLDGHISDVYVFGVAVADAGPLLVGDAAGRFNQLNRPNHAMKPTAPLRRILSVFATAPRRGLSLSR